jgi:glycopeptide antibiotics resistance protein
VLTDVVVCNTIGIIIGYNLMKILKREMYDFFGAYDDKRVKKPLK